MLASKMAEFLGLVCHTPKYLTLTRVKEYVKNFTEQVSQYCILGPPIPLKNNYCFYLHMMLYKGIVQNYQCSLLSAKIDKKLSSAKENAEKTLM